MEEKTIGFVSVIPDQLGEGCAEILTLGKNVNKISVARQGDAIVIFPIIEKN